MKNQFARPELYDHEILDENGKKIGSIRVTPTALKWKKKGAQTYSSVTLDKFVKWIEDSNSGATKTKK